MVLGSPSFLSNVETFKQLALCTARMQCRWENDPGFSLVSTVFISLGIGMAVEWVSKLGLLSPETAPWRQGGHSLSRSDFRKERHFRSLVGVPSQRSYFPLCFLSQEIPHQIQVNPSFSSLSPHLVLFSRRRRNSWLFLRRKSPWNLPLAPSTQWDSTYFSVRHLSVNYLTVAPTSMLMGAKPTWPSSALQDKKVERRLRHLQRVPTSPRCPRVACYHSSSPYPVSHHRHLHPDSHGCRLPRTKEKLWVWPFTLCVSSPLTLLHPTLIHLFPLGCWNVPSSPSPIRKTLLYSHKSYLVPCSGSGFLDSFAQ